MIVILTAEEAYNLSLKAKEKLIKELKEDTQKILLEIDSAINDAIKSAEFSISTTFDSSSFIYPDEVLTIIKDELQKRNFVVKFYCGNFQLANLYNILGDKVEIRISWDRRTKNFY